MSTQFTDEENEGQWGEGDPECDARASRPLCVDGRHRGEPTVEKELQRCSHTSVCTAKVAAAPTRELFGAPSILDLSVIPQ